MPQGVDVKKAHSEILSFEEIAEIAEAAIGLGVRKIRLTGGEPLVRRGMPELCGMLSALPGLEELCVTTNGTLLSAACPFPSANAAIGHQSGIGGVTLAAALKDAGVTRLNISLDTLDPEKYTKITGGGRLEDVLLGLEAADAAGFTGTKINAVLIGGFNDSEIRDLAGLSTHRNIEVRFIELMPVGAAAGLGAGAFISSDEVLKALPELEELEPARLYRLPGAKGRVGIISPISCSFCGSCNRLRLTADGYIKPCLHSDREIKVRGLHSAELEEALRQAILSKPKEHGRLTPGHMTETKRSMNRIGG